VGRKNLAVGLIVWIVVHRRTYACCGVGVVSILSMVKYVERLSAELEGNSLRKLEVLADAHIPVVDTRPAQNIASAISELARKGLNEACSVEKLVDALVEPTVWVTPWYQVCPLGKCRKQAEFVVGEDRVRESLLECGDARDLLSANRQISRPVHIPAEAFASPYRQLIHDTGHKTVVDIKVGTPVIEALIVLVHMTCEGVG